MNSKRRTGWKEKRRGTKKEKKAKKEEDDGNKESSKRVGDLGWRKRNRKIRERGKKFNTKKIPQVDQSFWEKSRWENTNKEDMRPYNRFEGEICTKKRENISLIQRRERESKKVYLRANKKGVYLTIKVATNYVSVLCREEK